MLKINDKLIMDDYLLVLFQLIDRLTDTILLELRNNSPSINSSSKNKSEVYSKAKNDNEKLSTEFEETKNRITGSVASYTNAILASYGTGSESVAPDEYWAEYIRSSLFNPHREGKSIVGREKGKYSGILDGVSTGSSVGKEIKGMDIKPTFVIQNVESEYFGTGGIIQRRLDEETKEFFKKIFGNPRYFTYS